MLRKNSRRLGGMLCFLWIILAVNAQYSVTGGSKTPLLAKEDASNYVKVYLVYGTNGVELSYTSTASSHQWYRYKTRWSESEKVSSELNGSTSTVRNPEEGYGYFVQEGDAIPREFLWIIDYSKYAFNPQTLEIAENICTGFRLGGVPAIPQLHYSLPKDGKVVELERQFKISFQTLAWSEENKLFSQITVDTIVSNPYKNLLNVNRKGPLCDTEVLLTGDSYASYFNVEKSMSANLEAVAIELHTDTVVYDEEAFNQIPSDKGSSAPVEILFTAHANSPVAAVYNWTIYRDKGESTDENEEDTREILVIFPGEEVSYTFKTEGSYIAEVEVSGRDNSCAATFSYPIEISDSFMDVPNAFSPGTSPGINDEFRIAYRSIVSFKCWIFNRWGNQLYYWTDPAKGWDGKKGGKYVAPGVYFYVIEAKGSDGESYNKKGSINILRPKDIQDEVPQE